MANCDICAIMENKEAFKVIYEDDSILAILHESPSVPGHTLVIPKKHFPIFEEVPDEIIRKTFATANTISTAIFDSIGAQGTNLVVNNGLTAGQEHAHFLVNIIPRVENDGLNLEWTPKKVSDDGLKTTQSMIKTFADIIFSGKDLDVSKIKVKDEQPAPHEDKDDYLVRQLKRMP